MELSDHSILIIEAKNAPFIVRLQAAIEQAGGDSIVVRSSGDAKERVKQFNFSAAAANVEHRAVVEKLGIPYVLYLPAEPPGAVVAMLIRRLAGP
jgi:hypothetical protein